MRIPLLLLASLVPLWTAPALACTTPQDLRPYRQRLVDAPIAFVGTVTAITGLRVTFTVHHAINGSPGSSATIDALPPSTCSVSFAVGQRWLFAGPATSQPSVLLQADARSARSSDFGRFQRVDDARARFPSDWQSCTQNSQCEPVPIGCQQTAANSANAAAARAHAIRVVGDHRAMECATGPAEVQHIGQQCVAGRCGHWVLDFRLRP
ncbi:hypothetical protein [Piscinibacter koreensis]|uniref:Lipoprotein n=1 Tax=Piscinibacter koreensis TaxID=2742824 RepID=A0A7Y6TYX1_9BURK|nr:hypothetical protein [Schlegelella koreensis]NUZ08703.1 hypothetical protein [Schlegelella koreensis]